MAKSPDHVVRALSCAEASCIGASVAALGGTGWLIRNPGLLLGIRPRLLFDALILQVSLLFGHLRLVVLGELRLVHVRVDPILRDRALPAVTHAPMHRTSRANAEGRTIRPALQDDLAKRYFVRQMST